MTNRCESGDGDAACAEEWDAFLRSHRWGHVRQSSRWAKAKVSEGWRAIRRVVRIDDKSGGGFQMLARQTRLGRMGYIYKGPVLRDEDTEGIAAISSLIAGTARQTKPSPADVPQPEAVWDAF